MAKKKKTKKYSDNDENVGGLRPKNPLYIHLRRHYIATKSDLVNAIEQDLSLSKIALCLGALDCLYWQAMGLGEVKLAKGVRRLVAKSYQHHPIRVNSDLNLSKLKVKNGSSDILYPTRPAFDDAGYCQATY